jgi:hypothetical protein
MKRYIRKNPQGLLGDWGGNEFVRLQAVQANGQAGIVGGGATEIDVGI